jgi:hypothetical protein
MDAPRDTNTGVYCLLGSESVAKIKSRNLARADETYGQRDMGLM